MTHFEASILSPFVESVIRFPECDSFCIDGFFYSYHTFANRVVSIRGIIHNAKNEEQVWGLGIADNIETYAAIFALWLEGKAYIPLHPAWPSQRIASIVQQVGCHNVILTREDQGRFLEKDEHLTVYNVAEPELQNPQIIDNVRRIEEWVETDDDSIAYILFTSGSTGVPKGVQISRRNVAAFMDSFWQTGIKITEKDRCMQVFDLTFDVSVQSFLVALTRGACCYTVPYGGVKYLYAAGLINEQHVTFGAMAPSMLTYLRPYFKELDASSMKCTILTAEACPVDLMESWFECAKNTEIYDFYGPTEATIYCTFYKLSRSAENLSLNGIISIGKPLANVGAIIVDENGKEALLGEKGELCVSGSQVTPGYWKNDEKNESSFFIKDGNRYYHTGDLCFMREDGNIMYSGRIDQQAKIQGFRVELGEIEYHAREFFNKEKRVVAIAFQNASNLTEIALFVESEPMDTKPLLGHMRSKMPHYMIPTRILFEPSLPLNKSEKVDRNALKQRLTDC